MEIKALLTQKRAPPCLGTEKNIGKRSLAPPAPSAPTHRRPNPKIGPLDLSLGESLSQTRSFCVSLSVSLLVLFGQEEEERKNPKEEMRKLKRKKEKTEGAVRGKKKNGEKGKYLD